MPQTYKPEHGDSIVNRHTSVHQKRHLRVRSETSGINRDNRRSLEPSGQKGKQRVNMSLKAEQITFALASLLPAGAILAASFFGGIWPLIALLVMTALVVVMDRVGPITEALSELSRGLPLVIGCLHFLVLFSVVASDANAESLLQAVLLIVAAGLYAGQVSNSCAHELIHRPDRASRVLGTAIYCSILNGQHVSAHMLVHHVYAGTGKDPNSAPLGTSFYKFLGRVWAEEFRAGWRAENERRKPGITHPYHIYLGAAGLSILIATLLGGWVGLCAFLFIAVHAQVQLFLSDYVQHYGLRRAIGADGKPEPMGPQHSWNAPQAYSAAMMLNAPKHSDHHMHPRRSFAELELSAETMPMLPRSVPVMGAVAFIPPLWRRMMDHRAQYWSGFAAPDDISSGSPCPVATR